MPPSWATIACKASRSPARLRARPAPDLVQQLARRCRSLRHLIVEPVVGEGRKAEQLGPLCPQGNHLGDQRPVVRCSAIFAAPDPRLERLFAQVAPGRELQEALDR